MRDYFGIKKQKNLKDKEKLESFKDNRLTTKDAMEVFAISRGTLYNWVKMGLLEKFNIGRRTYYFLGPNFNAR